MRQLHIDIETYSSVDIRSAGAYKYAESLDFEILLICYAFNDGPVTEIDLASGENLPEEFKNAMRDPFVEKHAHNATFERICFKRIGFDVPIDQWYCSMVKAAYCGLPLKLDTISEVLKFSPDKAKLKTGTALINYFCKPCKPTKANGGRTRNLPEHSPEKWAQFIEYCINDVEAEREIGERLKTYEIPSFERINYIIDQEINDRGIEIDINMAQNAFDIDTKRAQYLKDEAKKITGLENPNSLTQLKAWLTEATGKEIETLAKGNIDQLIEETDNAEAVEVLELRKKMGKTSVKKYKSMLSCAGADGRARGLFQFYGANRTGRWAGRLVQMQNLPQNHLKDLDTCRDFVAMGDYDLMDLHFDNISDVLSQLIRTAFVARQDYTFGVADFSAIEARVLAWIAGETWRLDVFESHGKIYEASASLMFGIPIEDIGKGSDLRQKGKIAELALGYGGSVGALTTMGGEQMGLSPSDMQEIVTRWRENNPKITTFWKAVDRAFKNTLKTKKVYNVNGLFFHYDGLYLTIKLPSGRKLFYYKPSFCENRFGGESVKYRTMDQTTKKWGYTETYGGKITENIVQAISRDLLAYSMLNLASNGFSIVLHVHDEAVCEIIEHDQDARLDKMIELMEQRPPWALGLPLRADGYISTYYKKD